MNKILKLILFCVVIVFMAVENGFSGGMGHIGDPIILPGVKHKILVLEYDSPLNTTWGKDISQIISQQILGTMTGIQSVGVVNLYQPENKVVYTPEKIEEIASEQKALVVIWGEFYTDEENIYLHSHLRIIPSKEFPESGLGLKYNGTGQLNASPPTLQLNFNPIKLPIQTLQKLHSYYNQTVIIRAKPNDGANEKGEIKPGDTYTINSRSGDWSEITLHNGIKGWIKHSTLSDEGELKEIKSTLKLAQGILQYIAGSYKTSVTSLEDYLNSVDLHQDNMNRAFSHLLLGTAELRISFRENDLLTQKAELSVRYNYEMADSILKDNAFVINYLTILKCASHTFSTAMEKKIIDIIKADNNIESVENLKSIYMNALISGGSYWIKRPSIGLEQQFSDRIKLLDEIKIKLTKN